jgi:hypothetical protein
MTDSPESVPAMSEETATARESMSYAGFCPGCGAMYAACVDRGDRRRVAKFVADLVKYGARIERLPSERVRQELGLCHCKDNAVLAKQIDLLSDTMSDD